MGSCCRAEHLPGTGVAELRRLHMSTIVAGLCAVTMLSGCGSSVHAPASQVPPAPGVRPSAAVQQQGFASAPAAIQNEFKNAPHGQQAAPTAPSGQ